MSKVEHLFEEIRKLPPEEIEAQIEAHQEQIRALRRLLLLINKSTPVTVELVAESPQHH